MSCKPNHTPRVLLYIVNTNMIVPHWCSSNLANTNMIIFHWCSSNLVNTCINMIILQWCTYIPLVFIKFGKHLCKHDHTPLVYIFHWCSSNFVNTCVNMIILPWCSSNLVDANVITVYRCSSYISCNVAQSFHHDHTPSVLSSLANTDTVIVHRRSLNLVNTDMVNSTGVFIKSCKHNDDHAKPMLLYVIIVNTNMPATNVHRVFTSCI